MVDWFRAVKLTAKRKCSCTCQAEGKSGGLRNQRVMTGTILNPYRIHTAIRAIHTGFRDKGILGCVWGSLHRILCSGSEDPSKRAWCCWLLVIFYLLFVHIWGILLMEWNDATWAIARLTWWQMRTESWGVTRALTAGQRSSYREWWSRSAAAASSPEWRRSLEMQR